MTIEAKRKNFLIITRSISLAVLLAASPVMGMVYMWKDSTGTAHYTNKEYEIPDRYRARAKALYPEAGDSGKPLLNSNVQAQSGIQPLINQQANPTEVVPVAAQQIKPEVMDNTHPAIPANSLKVSAPKPPAKRVRLPRAASDNE